MTFSVVIPVYNVAPYLRECLGSVCTAAARVAPAASVEMICVDDGSTDGSAEILDAFAEESARSSALTVRVFHRENRGVSAARNFALEVMTGERFLFVDSDDLVRESLFQDLLFVLDEAPDCELVGFGLSLFSHETPAPMWREPSVLSPRVIEVGDRIPDLFATFSAYRLAYRRDVFGDLRFPPYARGEDLVYVASAVGRAQSCRYFDREEYGYRDRPGSAVHVDFDAKEAHQAVAFHKEMFCVLAASGKSLEPGRWSLRLDQWLFRLPIIIARHLADPAWREVWQFWRESLCEAERMPFVRGGRAYALKVIRWIEMPILVTVVCRLALRLMRT